MKQNREILTTSETLLTRLVRTMRFPSLASRKAARGDCRVQETDVFRAENDSAQLQTPRGSKLRHIAMASGEAEVEERRALELKVKL